MLTVEGCSSYQPCILGSSTSVPEAPLVCLLDALQRDSRLLVFLGSGSGSVWLYLRRFYADCVRDHLPDSTR